MHPTEKTATAKELADDAFYRSSAIGLWANDKLEIDVDATVSAGEEGAWVHAWVWVSKQQAGIKEQAEFGSRE